MRVELMVIAGTRQAPYQLRVGGKYAKTLMRS
jgi:hypothetical protein